MPTKSEIIVDSNLTYVPNTSGLITPQQVQTLNANWINASIFPEQTGSMSVQSAATASFLLGSIASASFANQANSASQAISASTSQFANTAANATSASYALTASFALNVPATASFAISASFAQSASLATRNLTTASAVANILTFTKGDGSTFNVTIAQSGSVASASYADTANFANTAEFATSASLAQFAGIASAALSASYAFTASSAERSTTASFAISASRAISAATAVSATTATSALTAISASQATNANNALTASFVAGVATLSGNNTFTGITTFNNAVTMSNVQINGTASIQYLNVVFQSSSIIYSSGSNQLGDASNDTQTLWGTVNVISGPLVVTGSANFASVITGSISTALNANTASYVANAFISASQVGGNDKVSLTNAGGTTTTLTINNVASANSAGSANTATSASFATTAGNANTATTAATASSVSALNQTVTITGSVNVSGSISISQGSDLITHHVQAAAVNGVEIQNNSGNVVGLFGAGGSLGSTFYGQVNATAFSGSGALVYGVVSSSYAVSASHANSSTSASLAQLALTASYFDGLVASASYALVAETANNALTANTANSALTAINADTASFLNGNAVSASYAATASYALNAGLLDGLDSSVFATTGSNSFKGTQTIQSGSELRTNSIKNAAPGDDIVIAFLSGANLRINATNPTFNGVFINGVLQVTENVGITGSLNVSRGITGSLFGTASAALSASYATTASFFAGSVTSASFAQTSVTASFATNFINSGSYVITGSHRGNVVSQSIASSTASIDFADGNFFDLRLIGGANTHITAANIQAGQTANLRITQAATTGSVTFSSAFDQVSGSAYTPTAVSGAVDILTFITFDNSLIYVSNIKNLV